jgi:GxxExxY protein
VAISKLLYEEESYKIRGACFNVFNALGGGIRESIIEKALIQELSHSGLSTKKEKIDIFYKSSKIGIYIPDIIVNDKILIELKSKPFITKEDEKQFWGYLKGSKYELGFLINFGHNKLSIKRIVHSDKSVSA